MKTQVGVGNLKEFEYFLKAGADEFYCGFKNIPSHLYGGENFDSVKEVAGMISAAHKKKKTFFIAANEIQSAEVKKTVNFIGEMTALGADGVIIRDLSLLDAVLKTGLKTRFILSSLSPCYNEDALKFYGLLGINRLAIPEQLLPSEAAGLVKNHFGIETEMFLTAREYCVVFNGLCYLKQFNGQCLCRKEFSGVEGKKFVMPRPSDAEHMGNLYEFHKLGVPILKIGRHPTKDYSKMIFSEALAVIKLLDSGLSKEEFVKKAMVYHLKIGKLLEKWIKKA